MKIIISLITLAFFSISSFANWEIYNKKDEWTDEETVSAYTEN